MAKFRNSLLIAFLAILTACGGQSVWAPDEEVEKRRYVSNEPAYLELKTMINNRTGRGGHTSLVINGSQLVMWDPAGRWFKSLPLPLIFQSFSGKRFNGFNISNNL